MTNRDLSNLSELQSTITEMKKKFEHLISTTNQKVKKVNYERKKRKERLTRNIANCKLANKKSTEEIANLKDELEMIKKTTENEKKELMKIKNENSNLNNLFYEYENSKTKLSSLIDEMEKRLHSLQLQKKNEMRKNEISGNKLSVEVSKYRRLLGINIVRMYDNVIKIEFSNFNATDFRGYVVIDFKDDNECVCEIYPDVIALDKINQILNQSDNFYMFLKKVRCIFYDSIKENICNQ